MRIVSLLIIFFVLQHVANSQQNLHDPISGRPYLLRVNEEVRGNLFLFEDSKPANVTIISGYVYSGIMVLFDIYNNHFFYTHNDTTYEFVTELSRVELFPLRGDTATKMVFKKGFSAGEKVLPDKFVQVLTEGKITSIKYISKVIDEITEYNVPGKVKVFNNSIIYYFINEGKAVSQRPGPKLLQEILKDKWATIDAYMKQNQLNTKSEDDCIKAIKYYNTL